MALKLDLELQSQSLSLDDNRRNSWVINTERRSVAPHQCALLLCDVWDLHHSRGAWERLDTMLARLNEVAKAVRSRGVTIIHSPSGTMDFYERTQARQRVLDAPVVATPDDISHDDPPMPVDTEGGGTDTGETPEEQIRVWTRQHPDIEIDDGVDGISDDGAEVYRYLKSRGVTLLLIMGVHTNMCMLNRSFAIKQMVRWGMDVALIRDLTDTMYDPARPPYVSHEEGTRLVIEYIEKFWCPTITSDQLLS